MSSEQPDLTHTFSDPPREFGMIPLWMWNDDLDEAELLRQVREFHAKGFGGFIPHPRIGLSRRVGYLTDEYFRLVRLVVEEAARLGMKVILYDEGAYPSGSAQGRVVAENPDWAARCLIAVQKTITGPAVGYWRPNSGRALRDELQAVVLARETAPGALDPESLTVLPVLDHGLVRYDVPEGAWRLVSVWSVFSGGTIRGVFEEDEDGHATAPPAADILNPDAVASFIRHTHDQYYAHLREHFGKTVVAMFTDEPNPMGRGVRRGPHPKPYTPGLLDEVQAGWDGDVRRWLPALWLDCGPRTEAFREAYHLAVKERVGRAFYAAQSRWCAAHGIALTGHPSDSDEMDTLRHFQWPGQDIVWRYIEPGAKSAMEGPHSTCAKVASSAAIVQGAPRNGTEVFGAFGWRLTLDEVKWLLDWHFVRGTNLIIPHACFYSIRERRAFESEPDIGVHNVWWRHFGLIGDYARRMCWLLAGATPVVHVAILTDPLRTAWAAAGELLRNQIDFIYVDAATVATAPIENGCLRIGGQRIRCVVCDPPGVADITARTRFTGLRNAAGTVVESWEPGTLAARVAAAVNDVIVTPTCSDLRVAHYTRAGREFYLLVNEGERTIGGDLAFNIRGALEWWNALDGSTRTHPATWSGDRLRTSFRLARRESALLVIVPGREPMIAAATVARSESMGNVRLGPWQAFDDSGQPIPVPCPGDWSRAAGWEVFSGTVRFTTEFTFTGGPCLCLDLGRVGDIAEVWVNGERVGVRAWAPYEFLIRKARPNQPNQLEVRVTNSMANAYDGHQKPSGILGPVSLMPTERMNSQ